MVFAPDSLTGCITPNSFDPSTSISPSSVTVDDPTLRLALREDDKGAFEPFSGGVVNVDDRLAMRGILVGVSFGNPLSIEPDLDVFNDDAFESIDFAIMAARLYGLKVCIYLYTQRTRRDSISLASYPFS